MLMRRSQSVSQTERQACARWFSLASIFKKTNVVIFLLVAIISMIVSLTGASLARAQQPTPPAKTSPRPNISGLPTEPPEGWDPSLWERRVEDCNQVREKARAHKVFTDGDFSTMQVCQSLYIDTHPQSPPSDSYPNPPLRGPSLSLPAPTPEAALRLRAN